MSIFLTDDDATCAAVKGSWPAPEAETATKRSRLMLFDTLIVNSGIQRDTEQYWSAMVDYINQEIRS